MNHDTSRTIVLIHGLWLTPRSWENWVAHYSAYGYNVIAHHPDFHAEKAGRLDALRSGRGRILPMPPPPVPRIHAPTARHSMSSRVIGVVMPELSLRGAERRSNLVEAARSARDCFAALAMTPVSKGRNPCPPPIPCPPVTHKTSASR